MSNRIIRLLNFKIKLSLQNLQTFPKPFHSSNFIILFQSITTMQVQNFSSTKSHSPSKQPSHNQQLKHHLQLVFIYYSSFADRNNYHLLKHQNYRRFLIDSQIVRGTSDFPEFDILFKKISKGNSNAVSYEEFLKLLPEIAGSVYEGQNRQAAFKKFIKHDIKKLQTQIRQHSEFGLQLSIVQQFLSRPSLSKQQQQIIHKLSESSIIKKCYEVYISSTSMHQKCPADTFESFYKFLKDFEISPQLIYKSICYVTFITLLMKKPEGVRNQFDIETFIKMIVLLNEIITRKELINEGQISAKERICRVLEKMEVSPGFQKVSKLVKGETYYSMSLVRLMIGNDGFSPTKRLENQLQEFSSVQKNLNNSANSRYRSYMHQPQRPPVSSFDSLNTLANEPQQFRQIKRIFEDLCSYGQVGNNKTLKSMKIKKLYTQTGLLKVVTQVWLDLTITELTRRSSSGKIEFIQFVELMNQTAKKLNVNESQIYNLIITNARQLNINQFNSLTTSAINYDQKEIALCMEMLQTIAYPLERIFHFYSKSKNQISFPQLTKLMYDFQVFPAIITKTRLYQIFCQCYEQSIDKINYNENFKTPDLFLKEKEKYNTSGKKPLQNKYISVTPAKSNTGGDPHLKEQKLMHISTFPVMMLKISNQICQQALKGAQKLIILIQKMHQSKGQQKVVIGKGSLVSQLRKLYPHVYKMSFGLKDTNQKKQEDIDDLLDTISEY